MIPLTSPGTTFLGSAELVAALLQQQHVEMYLNEVISIDHEFFIYQRRCQGFIMRGKVNCYVTIPSERSHISIWVAVLGIVRCLFISLGMSFISQSLALIISTRRSCFCWQRVICLSHHFLSILLPPVQFIISSWSTGMFPHRASLLTFTDAAISSCQIGKSFLDFFLRLMDEAASTAPCSIFVRVLIGCSPDQRIS